MSSKKAPPRPVKQRINEVHRQIRTFGYVARGTIVKTYTKCGRPTCHCGRKGDPGHGPYLIWSRLEDGKLVRSRLTKDRAAKLGAAIRDHRKLTRILRKWEAISVAAIHKETS